MSTDPHQTVADLIAADRLLAAGFPEHAEAILTRLQPERGRNALSHIRIGRTDSARKWLAEAIVQAQREAKPSA